MATEHEPVTRFIRDIVGAVQPLKIILFGSRARGEAGKYSDVDLLVVMPDGTFLHQIARKLYRDIRREGVPLDLVVTTPSILERHRDNPGLIYHSILKEGREVYAAD